MPPAAPAEHHESSAGATSQQEIDVEQIIAIAREAGGEIMRVYAMDFSTEQKEDKSPLTEADKRSNAVIVRRLGELFPAIPFVSEETKLNPYSERKNWRRFWLIDPLDGTKEFIKRNGEFTVNIALIEDGIPVLGVVFAPALNRTYFGIKGAGSFRIDENGSRTRLGANVHYSAKDRVTVVGSRSHLSDETLGYVENLRRTGKEVEFRSSGSSLKFCLVAEGEADVYPRFGPTMEWDTGAAHAVALYAGRKVVNAGTLEPLVYNKENLLNPFFIVE